MYQQWARYLPPTIDLRAVKLPGRHTRHREPAFTDSESAAEELAEALGPEFGPHCILFGHSMGALLGYRLLRVLEGRGCVLPALFVAASWTVFGVPTSRMPDPDDPDEEFVRTLRGLGGVAPELFDNPDLLALTLPMLRADFRLCRSYVYRPDEPPLRIPLSVMGGTSDTVTPAGELKAWSDHARRFVGLRLFSGGHFFIRDDVPGVVAALVEDFGAVTR
jgi:surfactin synthase thioesterase subunit